MVAWTGPPSIVAHFLSGPLPVIIIVASLLAGLISLQLTPREEEPQINVTFANVFIAFPGDKCTHD